MQFRFLPRPASHVHPSIHRPKWVQPQAALYRSNNWWVDRNNRSAAVDSCAGVVAHVRSQNWTFVANENYLPGGALTPAAVRLCDELLNVRTVTRPHPVHRFTHRSTVQEAALWIVLRWSHGQVLVLREPQRRVLSHHGHLRREASKWAQIRTFSEMANRSWVISNNYYTRSLLGQQVTGAKKTRHCQQQSVASDRIVQRLWVLHAICIATRSKSSRA